VYFSDNYFIPPLLVVFLRWFFYRALPLSGKDVFANALSSLALSGDAERDTRGVRGSREIKENPRAGKKSLTNANTHNTRHSGRQESGRAPDAQKSQSRSGSRLKPTPARRSDDASRANSKDSDSPDTPPKRRGPDVSSVVGVQGPPAGAAGELQPHAQKLEPQPQPQPSLSTSLSGMHGGASTTGPQTRPPPQVVLQTAGPSTLPKGVEMSAMREMFAKLKKKP
jgi:hypothetical protein